MEAEWVRVNRENWDDRAGVHAVSEFYDLDGFRTGASTLRSFEPGEAGDVAGRSLLHLQCHLGLDTLSWARLGARTTGLDFSAAAIDTARRLAADTGLAAQADFVVSDVYNGAETLAGQRFDIVYTGLGSLLWLPELAPWARTVAALLKPGGFLYLVEFHPFADTLDEQDGRTVAFDYFDTGAQHFDDAGTYTDGPPLAHTRSVQWHHPLGEVLSALASAGLRLDFLHERDVTLFQRFAVLRRNGGEYRYPDGAPRVPLSYSLRATLG